MSRLPPHTETHSGDNIAWLRAAVLGANDGILSTASLMAGVAAADASPKSIMIAGIAGLVAGALSMAAGEYVSVSSQADAENADLTRERKELAEQPEFELAELSEIYVKRGLDPALARKVAEQLMAKDALAAHARDELGITELSIAQPVVAAAASAASFAVGAAVPILSALVAPAEHVSLFLTMTSLICLAGLGALGAWAGKANIWPAVTRVTFWGAIAMALTAAIGSVTGTAL